MFKFIDVLVLSSNNVCRLQKPGCFINCALKTLRYIIYTALTYFVHVYSNVPLCFCYYVLFCVYFRHLPLVYVNVVQLSHRSMTVWY